MTKDQQFLVTNIKLTSKQYGTISAGHNVIDKFKIPTDIDISGWFADYNDGQTLADKTAYALYVRTLLFNNFEITYDFQPIEPAVTVDNVLDQMYMVDVIDQSYAEYTTARVRLDVPMAYIAELTADDLELHHDDIEQAIYENMINRLELNINVLTTTDLLLELLSDCMNESDAPAPDSISELAYDIIIAETISETELEVNVNIDMADRVQDAVFQLASALVKDIGKYM